MLLQMSMPSTGFVGQAIERIIIISSFVLKVKSENNYKNTPTKNDQMCEIHNQVIKFLIYLIFPIFQVDMFSIIILFIRHLNYQSVQSQL